MVLSTTFRSSRVSAIWKRRPQRRLSQCRSCQRVEEKNSPCDGATASPYSLDVPNVDIDVQSSAWALVCRSHSRIDDDFFSNGPHKDSGPRLHIWPKIIFPCEFDRVRVGPAVNYEIVLFPFDVLPLDLGFAWPALKEAGTEHQIQLLESYVWFHGHICLCCGNIHLSIGTDQGAWCAPVLLHRPV